MSNYLALLRNPGVVRVLASQLLARFAFGMMSLGFVIHIQHITNSYAIAGLALGAETIGAAVSGPVLGRKIGPWGVQRVIILSTIVTCGCLLAIGLVPMPPLLLIALAAIVGLSSPPIQSSARTIYPTLAPKRQHQLLFSLDATLQELIWIIGPVLATLVAAQFFPAAVLILMAVIQVVGSAWFLSNPEVRTVQIPASAGRLGGVLKNRVVLTLAIIGLLLVGGFSGVEVGTVAILDISQAGWVIAALSVGSLIGGFWMGPKARSKWAMSKFVGLILLGYALAFVFPESAAWLALCWFIAGLGIAPALGLLSNLISMALKISDTAEAYGWINTGQLMGYSTGAALAGIAIDTVSPVSALLIAVLFGSGTLLVALLSTSILPALERTDTKSIPVVPTSEEK
jgi:MFS family permease